ncbi:MAG: transporter substrate-binding domain-containing protein [Endozoicomonas sp.]|uniref:transporter substrate-binding domain-containing protein n=1 Tax=Endozoicomonas sp. TaxID=1892382 RepID=UPI003D9B44E5
MKNFVLIAALFLNLLSLVQARDLPEILSSGVLRVGTTGDYPPLTECNQRMQCSGFAIDLAESLGKYLSKLYDQPVKVKYVKTNWPDLSADLKNDHFDIAMGGIGYSKSRAKHFLLSNAITPCGKVVLIRKEFFPQVTGLNDQALIAALNRPEIRVVENPGGLNQEFAEQHLPNAQLIITANNKEPFLILREDKADLMITDLMEAQYRLKKNPALTIVNPAMFTESSSHKVFMMQKSSRKLADKVNLWLSKTNIEGLKKKWF